MLNAMMVDFTSHVSDNSEDIYEPVGVQSTLDDGVKEDGAVGFMVSQGTTTAPMVSSMDVEETSVQELLNTDSDFTSRVDET